ncbi:MAG: ABC transporter permease, partial [Gemmatimonadota bacterium]|nr:ABC transporter permease [Gemmatimonadota bacterium]
MHTLFRDSHLAVRRLAGAPGFTGTALLILALGIGATTAIFSVVNGVLLRSLPFNDPDRLVMVYTPDGPAQEGGNLSFPDFTDIRAQNRVLAGMAATNFNSPALTAPGVEPSRQMAIGATANLFSLLGVAPALGRTFAADADVRRECVVVLSDALWRSRFGGEPDAVGRAVTLDG